MSEESTPKKSKNIKHGAKKAAHSAKSFAKKPIAKKLLIVLLVIACAYGIFYLGQQSGIAKQKELDKKLVSSSRDRSTDRPSATQNRKTFIGTVASISDKQIEVTPRTGDKAKVVITETTRITGSDGKKTDVKAIKKDQKVIVSTTKDKDGKYTATRIRIQK